MKTAFDIFRLMMRDEIAPELRRIGFKGSGQSFTLPSETHWVLLAFQKSTSNTAKAVRFTVNLTVVSKRTWAKVQALYSHLPDRPSANVFYTAPGYRFYGFDIWQRRIGHLRPDPGDTWWTVTTRWSVRRVKVDVLEAIRKYALPAIEHQVTQEAGED